jgi:glycosyltransferase involved in cell wall biosynthesis
VYDAHEWFPEMKEVVSRPLVHKAWLGLEKWMVPRFPHGYTVSEAIAGHFKKSYGVEYALIRNLPLSKPWPPAAAENRVVLYQGAVNEGRCFEQLVPAMKLVRGELHIYGDGNYLEQARALVRAHGLEKRVFFKGKRLPGELARITPLARVGITLFDPKGMSNLHSLANRFFDYIQAGLPQLCSDFPAYREINRQHEVAVLLERSEPEEIAHALNNLLDNEVLYSWLRSNCREAAKIYTWENESGRLTRFYQNLLS